MRHGRYLDLPLYICLCVNISCAEAVLQCTHCSSTIDTWHYSGCWVDLYVVGISGPPIITHLLISWCNCSRVFSMKIMVVSCPHVCPLVWENKVWILQRILAHLCGEGAPIVCTICHQFACTTQCSLTATKCTTRFSTKKLRFCQLTCRCFSWQILQKYQQEVLYHGCDVCATSSLTWMYYDVHMSHVVSDFHAKFGTICLKMIFVIILLLTY